MKPIVALAAFTAALLLGSAHVSAQSLDRLFAAGNEAYFRGDYARAAANYERLVEAGVHDPDVYFNLATANARSGRYGRAVLFFERSRQHRVSRVRSRGAFNKFTYHARGPVRLARDFVLKVRRPESVAADLDWLYGYKAQG